MLIYNRALVTLDTAMAHLSHFCAVLPQEPYVDLRPIFSFDEDVDTKEMTATVTLPSCVNSGVRKATGLSRWRTERAARKDAAFEAYALLRSAGLVNDHLLPLREMEQDVGVRETGIASSVEVSEQCNPWIDVVESWKTTASISEVPLRIEGSNGEQLRMRLYLPIDPPPLSSCALHWNSITRFTVISEDNPVTRDAIPATIQALRDATHLILQSVHSQRTDDERWISPALFAPDVHLANLQSWTAANYGVRPALSYDPRDAMGDEIGLVRDKSNSRARFELVSRIIKDGVEACNQQPQGLETNVDGSIQRCQSSGTECEFLEALPLPKRRDFLHLNLHITGSELSAVSSKGKSQLLSARSCTVDNLPFKYSRFALFIPPILHLLEVALIAERVRRRIIPSVALQDLSLVVTAISASSAREQGNYQKLELLGDSVLKYLATTQLFCAHADWHEGYLSAGKDRIVSNSRLARAARDVSLDGYIITRPFTARKWTPSGLSAPSVTVTRVMSSKILADVVESLIGAAFLDGGVRKAAQCARIFLPELDGQQPNLRFLVKDIVTPESSMPVDLTEVEDMIGYSFRDKVLLREALTHPSCQIGADSSSYQRLEFLGDAVLDYVVVARMCEENLGGLAHSDLHLGKTALVNGDFLAFLCLELSTLRLGVDVRTLDGKSFRTIPTTRLSHIWQYMRHHHPRIVEAQRTCVERHMRLRGSIISALAIGCVYPWVELAQLEAPKFLSDIIEALVGAIFVDSRGQPSACKLFLERMGLLRYLRRLVGPARPDLLHPKENLGHIAGDKTVRYEVTVKDGGYECIVHVGDEEIIRIADGSSRVEVQTRAAQGAAAMLTNQRKNAAVKAC